MRFVRVLVSVLLGAVLLTACGKHNSAVDETPKNGGELREGLVQLASNDPAKAQTVSERQMADQLYDGLTAWSPTTLKATPSLASKWEASEDQKSFTFHLRADAKADNGEPVTSADVKRSLEHIARKSAGSVSTDLLSDVVGFRDFTNNAQTPALTGVVAVDATTVRIDLEQPFAELPLLLGNPTFGIVHYGAGDTTYSTGPYMVDNAPDPTHVKLKKSPGSTAHLDSIAVNFYPDVDTSYAAFEKNDVDWTPVSPDKADAASKSYGSALFRTSLRTLYLSFNLDNSTVSSAPFRQAILQAINRQVVASSIGASSKLIDGIVPDNIPGHEGAGCGAPCAYDLGHAKTQIGVAFPNGGVPSVVITAPPGAPLNDSAGQKIVADLAGAGITATVNRLPNDQFNAFTVDPTRQIFQTSWSAAYPSSGAFLQPLFQAGSTSNVSDLNDQKITTDIGTAEKTADDTQRNKMWADIESEVLAQQPVIPVAAFPVFSVKHAKVRGIDPLPTGNFDVAQAWVS